MCIQDPPAEPTERLGPNLLHVPREKDDIDVALHEGPTYGRVQVGRVRIGVTLPSWDARTPIFTWRRFSLRPPN